MPRGEAPLRRNRRVTVTTAWRRLIRSVPPPRSERIATLNALGRVAAVPVRARIDLPRWDQSAMDGYAVRLRPSERPEGATLHPRVVVGLSLPGTNPVSLPLVGVGTTVQVLTGAPIPARSDAVVPQEQCARFGGRIVPRGSIFPGRNIVRRGEDVRRGFPILARAQAVRPWHLAALRAQSIDHVRVTRLPCVAVLATGSEIKSEVRSGTSPHVPDASRPMVLGLLAELGVPSIDLGIAPDREQTIRSRVRSALTRCDMIITIGGSSAGMHDRVPRAVEGLGGVRWIARGVRERPGGTCSIAVTQRRPVFLLGGPPVAAFAGFVNLVEPFLVARYGRARRDGHSFPVALAEPVPHRKGIREILLVRMDWSTGHPQARPLGHARKPRLSALAQANGLVILHESHGPYTKGELVPVRPMNA